MSLTSAAQFSSADGREHTLLNYIADLELEVDRLRRQIAFLHQSATEAAKTVDRYCRDAPAEANPGTLRDIQAEVKQLREILHDLRESQGFHPAHDHIVPIAVRPLLEQVLRWHQRISNLPQVSLRLELEQECLEWFPARLRNILDNLIGNALADTGGIHGEIRLTITVRETTEGYELRLSSNGPGRELRSIESLALFHRSSPARSAELNVGLAVVKMLVEQSGGKAEFHSGEDQCTHCLIMLPRFDLHDHL